MTLDSDTAEALFYEAVDLPDERRRAFLDERCGHDDGLRREVELLLYADGTVTESFLRRPSTRVQGVYLTPGSRLGSYTVGECIGEGGMGTVYAARQESPHRDVALKVIRPDRLSAAALRRFRYEAEILGSLQHAGIAQVFEAGEAEVELGDGTRLEQPFLVMELVRGTPLLDYVHERGLSRRDRIELVARICDAVHHAHQRGVIHRDLKPDNVLVVEGGDESIGTPKVLDFGIARSSDPIEGEDGEGEDGPTRPGQLIGSLASMSPEQVGGDPRRVDARSDVYALGVLLYRLLSERFPVDISDCSVPEAVRRIAEGEPPRLSSIDSALRGDLTVIAARALDVDRDRRYSTAGDLAADLRRYLEGRPIVARTDSALYVLGKTIRRHRTFSVAAVAVLGLLAAFGIVSSLQATRLRRELFASTIERGRLVGLTDNFLLAEEMLWSAYLRDPASRHAYWALWELYARNPCLGSWPLDLDLSRPVAFHPEGLLFAAGRAAPGLVLWDAQGNGPIDELDVGGVVQSVDFHPQGTTLAVGTSDGHVSLWSTTGRPLHEIADAHQGPVLSVAFAPDGERLATAGADGALRLWAPDGKPAGVLAVPAGAIEHVTFGPAGSLLACSGKSGEILVWRDAAEPPLARFAARQTTVRALAFSADGRVLASGGDSQVVRLWDPESGELLDTLEVHNGAVRYLEFDPREANTLLISGWWKFLAWDLDSGERKVLLNHGFDHGALSRLSNRLVGIGPRHLRIWDLEPRSHVRIPADPRGGVIVAVDPRSERFATGDRGGVLGFHDAATGGLEQRHELGESIGAIDFHPRGDWVAVGLWNSVRVLDPATGEQAARLEGYRHRSAASLAFSSDGLRLAHTASGGRVRVLDTETWSPVHEIQVTRSQALGVAFRPDGTMLATTFRSYRVPEFGVRMWSPEGGLLWESLTDPAMFGVESTQDIIPWRPAFSDDGSRLAAGGWGNLVLVWDSDSGEIESVLRDHKAVVWDVAFVPGDSDTLASASGDDTVKLWHVSEERCLATLNSPADQGLGVSSVAFAHRGETLVVGGHAGSTLWDLTYFDRHVAGNLPFQLARSGGELGGRVERGRLEAWAGEVLARPWPRFESPVPPAARESR